MRKLIYPVLAIALLCSHRSNAQVDTLFFDGKWKATKNRDSFAYFRPQPQLTDGRYEVRDYFLNGNLQMVGHYSSNATNVMEDEIDPKFKDGKFEYYYDNGKLENEGLWKDGKRIGVWTGHYRHGGVKSTTSYKKGKLHGASTEFDSLSGMPLYISTFKDDVGTGTWPFYFRGSKQLRSEIILKNSKPHGRAVYFDSLTGKVITTGAHSEGKRDGVWFSYDRLTGELVSGETYVDGKKHGETFFYTPGTKQKWLVSHFVDDTLHGELLTYYESGKLKRREFYASNQAMSSACYDQKGEQVECPPLFIDGRFAGDIMTYIGQNLRYPEEAKRKKLEGKVVISFILSKTGMIQNPVISSGFDAACDAEALRLVAQMPPWEPQYLDGIPIESVKSLPVVFWLPEEELPAASN